MSNCLFCKIARHEIESNILYEDETCIAFLDISQATYGHTLVISKQHYTNILDVDKQTLTSMMEVVQKLAKYIQVQLDAKGVNILTNANKSAGQTVMHFHIHIIPRYNDDDGFNTTFTTHQYNLDEIKHKLAFK